MTSHSKEYIGSIRLTLGTTIKQLARYALIALVLAALVISLPHPSIIGAGVFMLFGCTALMIVLCLLTVVFQTVKLLSQVSTPSDGEES